MAKKSNAVKKETAIIPVEEPKSAPLTVVRHKSLLSEDIPLDKVTIPRLRIIQSQSEAYTIHGNSIGHYENSITKKTFGDTALLIPVKVGLGALYMKVGKGLICKSNDGVTSMFGKACAQCPFGVYYDSWGEKGEAPMCGATVDVLCLMADSMSPIVVTFTKTSYKEGKNLASAMKLEEEWKAFKIGSQKDKNDKGTFFIHKVLEWVSLTDDQYNAALTFRKQISQRGFNLHDDNVE